MGQFDQIIDHLIKRNKKQLLHYQTPIFGNSALHLACRNLQKKSVEKLLLARSNLNLQNKSDLDTPLHILVKIYETYQSQNSDISNLDLIEDIISTILPFCEKSLGIKNRNEKSPLMLVQSDSLKTLFKEHFDFLFLEEVSPLGKKNSSGSSDDPIDLDEFSPK